MIDENQMLTTYIKKNMGSGKVKEMVKFSL